VSTRLQDHRRELVFEAARAYDRGVTDMALDIAETLEARDPDDPIARMLRDFVCQMQEHEVE
jgi:hypothetical protein